MESLSALVSRRFAWIGVLRLINERYSGFSFGKRSTKHRQCRPDPPGRGTDSIVSSCTEKHSALPPQHRSSSLVRFRGLLSGHQSAESFTALCHWPLYRQLLFSGLTAMDPISSHVIGRRSSRSTPQPAGIPERAHANHHQRIS